MSILVGTSGFSYPDWRGRFYPPDLPQARFLEFYTRHFPAVELNFTHYRPPSAAMLARMVERSAGLLEFVVKVPKEISHERRDAAPIAEALVEAVRPVEEAGRFAAFLVQYPWSFRPSDETRARVAALRSQLQGRPTVVEFRNAAWVGQDTFDLLRSEGLSFCAVDEPRLRGLVPPLGVVTAQPGYVRFHGRNAGAWWNHAAADHGAARYDYRYADDELREWLPRLRGMDGATPKTFAFFNNHTAANAVEGAKRLRELLDGEPAPD